MENVLDARIAGMYFGCKAKGQDERNPHFPPEIGEIIEVSECKITLKGKQISEGVKDCDNEFMPFEVKLLLKSLSRISDEDAIEVAKILDANTKYSFGVAYHFDKIEGIEVATGKKYMQSIVRVRNKFGNNYGFKIMDFSDNGMQNYKVIDYLRSKCIDCDNLIHQGIAEEIK